MLKIRYNKIGGGATLHVYKYNIRAPVSASQKNQSNTCSVISAYYIVCNVHADINECLPNGGLGPCAQNCTNTIGSFYCSCNTGYNISGYACNGNLNMYLYN